MTENAAREFVEKSTERVKDTYGKVHAAAKENTEVMEHTYSAASKGAADFNRQFLEMAQENMNAAFDFARHLTHIKSPSEFCELSATQMRKQFEMFTEQAKHLTTLAQKVATDASQPFQAKVAKTFKKSA
jgi:phasin